jgi:hypothetical protein
MQQLILSNLNGAMWLFLSSGLLILILEPAAYRKSGWRKEKKASIILGWINISLAVLAFVASWFVDVEG